MASNKNQHFVPRCYLRSFASNSDRKTTHLYNIDRATSIYDAPIKSQCSRDYFYGKDPLLEKAIQAVEEGYACSLPTLLSYMTPLTLEARTVITRFWLLQHLRTEAASQHMSRMTEEADGLIKHQTESFKVEVKQAVQFAMSAYADHLDILEDLKIVLARNRTNTPFITSDDPAILLNRWLQGNALTMGRGHGLQSAGLVCSIPLSPLVCCFLYDSDVYSVPNSKNWIDIRSEEDVAAINGFQYLNCAANLYFHDRGASKVFGDLRDHNHWNRPASRHEIHYAVKTHSENGMARYEVIDKHSVPEHEEALIHMETIRISPTRWPSLLRWRSGGFYFTNHSGSGHLRRAHVASRVSRSPYIKRRTGH